MKVIRSADLIGTPRESSFGGNARALIYLTAEEGTGFAFATVASSEGIETGPLHYPHHVKANYVLEGSGEIASQDGQSWPLEPGSFYVVGPDDHYHLKLDGPWKTASFFNPPIADGSFGESGPLPAGWGNGGRRMFVRGPGDYERKQLSTGHSGVHRPLLAGDGIGLSLSDLTTRAGVGIDLWYRNHVEANYLVEGSAEIFEKASGETHALVPGDMFVIGPRDKHRVSNTNGVRWLSIFNPPITGNERYDDLGGYPPTGDVPAAWL